MLKQVLAGLLLAALSSVSFADGATLEAQKKLSGKGYDVGVVDGIMGAQTRAAIRKFQEDSSISATGRLDEATRKKLGIADQQKEQGSVQYFAPAQSGGHTTAVQIAPPTMKCAQCEVMINGRWQCKSRAEVNNYPGAPAMCR